MISSYLPPPPHKQAGKTETISRQSPGSRRMIQEKRKNCSCEYNGETFIQQEGHVDIAKKRTPSESLEKHFSRSLPLNTRAIDGFLGCQTVLHLEKQTRYRCLPHALLWRSLAILPSTPPLKKCAHRSTAALLSKPESFKLQYPERHCHAIYAH